MFAADRPAEAGGGAAHSGGRAVIDLCVSVAISSGGGHVGAGGAPSAGETPAVQAAAQRPVLHAEAPAAEETREGALDSSLELSGGPTLWLCTAGVSPSTFVSLAKLITQHNIYFSIIEALHFLSFPVNQLKIVKFRVFCNINPKSVFF